MASIFVDSVSGSNTSPYDTWAKAATSLAGALAIATSSDTIYVSSVHSHSQTTAKQLVFPTSPGLRVLCVVINGATGNSGLATTAVEACGAGSVSLSLEGFAYIYGLSFLGATNSSGSCTVIVGGPAATAVAAGLFLESCVVATRPSSTTGAFIGLGANPSGSADDVAVTLLNCTLKFGAAQTISVRSGRIRLINTGFDSSGSTPTTLLTGQNGSNGSLLWEASDLSGEAWTNLVDAAWTATYDVTLRNCKLPASTTLSTGTHSGPGGVVVKLHNCDSADTQYNFGERFYAGTVVEETTIVRSGGGAQSYRMDSSANVKFPYLPLTVEGAIWNTTVGSAVTLTVEYVADENVTAGQGGGTSNAFTNAELFVEVQHQGTSGVPQGVIDIDDRAADVLATPADQASSSVTWTTTGLTTPKKGKMECTFTPQEVGYVFFKGCLTKASRTVYVDVHGASIA